MGAGVVVDSLPATVAFSQKGIAVPFSSLYVDSVGYQHF